MDDTKKHEIAGVSPPPPFEDVRVEMESYQPSYTRLSATGRAAFDAYDGPVNCGPPGRMNFDQGRRREMDAELKDRARALVERWFPAPGGEPEWSKAVMVDDLTTLLAFAARVRAAVLTEEDRRVWCERYAHYTANSGMGSSGAVEYANAELNRYREARAAWDARGEKE